MLRILIILISLLVPLLSYAATDWQLDNLTIYNQDKLNGENVTFSHEIKNDNNTVLFVFECTRQTSGTIGSGAAPWTYDGVTLNQSPSFSQFFDSTTAYMNSEYLINPNKGVHNLVGRASLNGGKQVIVVAASFTGSRKNAVEVGFNNSGTGDPTVSNTSNKPDFSNSLMIGMACLSSSTGIITPDAAVTEIANVQNSGSHTTSVAYKVVPAAIASTLDWTDDTSSNWATGALIVWPFDYLPLTLSGVKASGVVLK